MGLSTFFYRFFVSNCLTLMYSLLVLIPVTIDYVKNLIIGTPVIRMGLVPPQRLSDPKYGTHKYIKVNGITLHYVESGDESKPMMIFLHGYPEFWYSWRHQIVDFQKDFWCIAIDMRGYGDSERPDGVSAYKLDTLVEDIRDLVRQLKREKCILVSHDWGGLVASRFRDTYPEVLSAVIALATASKEALFTEIWRNPVQMKMSWYIFMYRMPVLGERLLQINNLQALDSILLVPGKDTVDQQDVECYKYWFGKSHMLTPPINYYRALFDYVVPDKKKREENVPFLVAHGASDNYLSKGLLENMKNEYSHIETTVVSNCGHFLQQEEPLKVNSLIREFLLKHKII